MTASDNGRRRRWIRVVATLATAAGLLLAAGVLAAPAAQAVADGTDVPDGRYTFSAALSFPLITRADGSTYSSACSGALISPFWIITAGHCLHDGNRNRITGPPHYEVQVTVGRATLSGPGGQTRQGVDVRQSPTEDVALVRLDRPVFGIIPLLVSPVPPRAGEVLRLTGWGSVDAEADLSHRPDRLQTGLVKVSSFTGTDVLVHGVSPKPTTSACPYDSGAPYFRTVGAVSFLVGTEADGPDCPHADDETTARTDTIAGWILSQVTGH